MGRICSYCKVEKESTEFYPQKSGKWQGLSSRCKPCHQLHNRIWAENNPEKKKEIARRGKEKNRQKAREACRAWRLKNKAYDAFRQKMRRCDKLQATPPWVDEEEEFLMMEAFYLAQLRSEMFGFKWHVDHIVPLKHKEACGLHCMSNLQVIPAIQNLRKRNLYIG
jgi:hypothetical protein